MKRKINILRSFQKFCITLVLCFSLCFICNARKTNDLFSCFSETAISGFRNTANSFVFSLRNSEGLGPFISNVTDPSRAIYSNSGIGFGSGDIWIRSDSETSAVLGGAYYVPSGVSNTRTMMAGDVFFYPDDWEVFYLA